jgi:hypothetical protein
MGEKNLGSVAELLKELDNRLKTIDSYPAKMRPYQELYNTILKTLPHLSSREEKRRIFKHTVTGLLGHYNIGYVSMLGVTKASVADAKHIGENSIVRKYSATSTFLKKIRFGTISEIDTDIQLEDIIQQNKFS